MNNLIKKTDFKSDFMLQCVCVYSTVCNVLHKL